MRNLTENEGTALRSLRGCNAASAPSVALYLTMTTEDAEIALQGLVKAKLARVKRTNIKGWKVYTAY